MHCLRNLHCYVFCLARYHAIRLSILFGTSSTQTFLKHYVLILMIYNYIFKISCYFEAEIEEKTSKHEIKKCPYIKSSLSMCLEPFNCFPGVVNSGNEIWDDWVWNWCWVSLFGFERRRQSFNTVKCKVLNFEVAWEN